MKKGDGIEFRLPFKIVSTFLFFSCYYFRDILHKLIHTNWFGKGQIISNANYDLLDSSKKRTKLTNLIEGDPRDSEFGLSFGRI